MVLMHDSSLNTVHTKGQRSQTHGFAVGTMLKVCQKKNDNF